MKNGKPHRPGAVARPTARAVPAAAPAASESATTSESVATSESAATSEVPVAVAVPAESESNEARVRAAVLAGLLIAASLLALGGCAGDAGDGTATLSLTPIAPPAAPGAGMPYVATDGDGFFLSWTEPTGEEGPTGRPVHAVRFASLDVNGAGANGAWSAPQTLAASDRFFVNWADFPSIASAGDGRLAAHWLARSADGTYDYDVVVSASTDGGRNWSEPRVIHADGVHAEHGFLSFFPRDDGFGAVWLDGRETAGAGGAMTLRAGVLRWDGTTVDEVVVDDRICDCCQTAAATTSDGVVAVYRGRSTDEIRDILSVRLVNGAWETPAPVHDDGWRIRACPVNGPAIAADGRRVATAWFTAADDTPRVRVAFSDDAAASWGSPLEVDDGAPLGRVDILLLRDGSALVVWLEAGDDDAAIMARRVHADGRMEDAHPLSLTSQARAAGFPRMAKTENDRILISWTEPAAETGGASTLRAAFLEVRIR